VITPKINESSSEEISVITEANGETTEKRITTLHVRSDAVEQLIKNGEWFVMDNFGNKIIKKEVMLYITFINNIDALEALFQQGADINSRDERGFTFLHTASVMNKVKVAKYLIERGAEVNARNDRGETSLMTAAMNHHKEFVEFLLQNGAEVNAKNNEGGQTTLMYAVTVGLGDSQKETWKDTVELLINNGADINSKSDSGHTALDYISTYSDTSDEETRNIVAEIQEMLIEKGAKRGDYQDLQL